MRTHRTMALAATLSVAAAAAIADVPSGAVAAHAQAGATSRPSEEALAILRMCESSNNYATDNGDGFYGAYQFMLGTWQSLGYGGYPNQASPAVQDEAVARLYARSGWAPWPGCSQKHNLAAMENVVGKPLPPVGHTPSASASMVVVADVPEPAPPPPPPAPPVEPRPAHSRFNALVAEFG